MVVINRISFLKEELLSGRQGTAHCSFNAHTGCEKVKIMVYRECPLLSQSSEAIVSILDYVMSACDAHDKSVTDRGHRHSCGATEVIFYIRRRVSHKIPAVITTSAAPQPAPDTDRVQTDVESLCAILDANIEQEVQRLAQFRREFAHHSETVDHLALQSPPDIEEQTAQIKKLVCKVEECCQAQEDRLQKLREIRGRAAQGVLSTSQCVQEMQAIRNPLVEFATMRHPP